MATEQFEDRLKIIHFSKEEAVKIITNLSAQLADIAIEIVVLNIEEKGQIKYKLCFTTPMGQNV
jgi:hypothetical protein